jgi:hypothetical protein
MTTKSTEVPAMREILIVCVVSGRTGDLSHCLELGGAGSMYDELYGVPPSIETNAHCEEFAFGVFPKKATDVPIQKLKSRGRQCKVWCGAHLETAY